MLISVVILVLFLQCAVFAFYLKEQLTESVNCLLKRCFSNRTVYLVIFNQSCFIKTKKLIKASEVSNIYCQTSLLEKFFFSFLLAILPITLQCSSTSSVFGLEFTLLQNIKHLFFPTNLFSNI